MEKASLCSTTSHVKPLANVSTGEAQHHVPHGGRQGGRQQGAAIPGDVRAEAQQRQVRETL